MKWERLSLFVAAAFAPAIFAILSLTAPQAWPFQALVTLQATLCLLVIVMIAHGANWLVDAACRIAQVLGLSHLVIGLTVVALGTSAPEIAASLVAGLGGNGDLAVANVVGSNVFNLCFILGGVAVLMRDGLPTERSLVVRDGPMLLLGTVLLFLFVGGSVTGLGMERSGPQGAGIDHWVPLLLNRRLERGEGLILLGLLMAYMVLLYRGRAMGGVAQEVSQTEEVLEELDLVSEDGSFGTFSASDVPLFLLGLATVTGGCHVLVGEAQLVHGALHGHGALWFARVFDVPQYVVGITVIAAGTSAPELVVSLVAALRGAHGLSAGNLVGSDIFNFFGVIGLSGLVLQPPVSAAVAVSPALVAGIAVPIVVVLAVIFFMRTGMRISRGEGMLLLLIGVARWAYDLAMG